MAAHWIQLIVVTVIAAGTIFAVGYWIEGRTALLHARNRRPQDPDAQHDKNAGADKY